MKLTLSCSKYYIDLLTYLSCIDLVDLIALT